MIRLNLDQLVTYLHSQNLRSTAYYFQNCTGDEKLVVDGWIDCDYVKEHLELLGVKGDLWKNVRSMVTSHMNTQKDFKFTFETEAEQRQAELATGYIDEYDCVRMVVKYPEGGEIDFPVKNRESYLKLLEFHGDSISDVYPTVHSYDVQDYL